MSERAKGAASAVEAARSGPFIGRGRDPSAAPFFARATARPPARLSVGEPTDRFEQEAEQVASQVVERKPLAAAADAGAGGAPGGETPPPGQAQRRAIGGGGGERSSATRSGAAHGGPLPTAVRSEMEEHFGRDFTGVRVHTGAPAAAAAEQLNAQAFTLGPDISFGRGQFEPDTPQGKHLLAHELTHVVQQGGAGPAPEAPRARPAVAVQHATNGPMLSRKGAAPTGPVLGRVPEHATPDAQGLIFTEPTASAPRDMLSELQAFARSELAHEVATGVISEDERRQALERIFILVFSDRARLYDLQLSEIGSYALREEPSIPSGYYLDKDGEFGAPVTAGGSFGFVPVVMGGERERTEVEPLSPFGPAPTDRFGGAGMTISGDSGATRVTGAGEWFIDAGYGLKALLARRLAVSLFLAIPPRRGAGRRFHWAEGRQRELQAVLAGASAPVAAPEPSSAAPTSGAGGPAAAPAPSPGATPAASDRPDRVVYWTSEDAPYLNVWVDGAVSAVRMREGESVEDLQARVRRSAAELRDARDPEQSTRVASEVTKTGFTEGGTSVPVSPELAISQSGRVVNAPAYPARIINYGPDITVQGATNSFSMELDYAPAGNQLIDQVAARMQHISYYWELIDVTGVPDPPTAARQNVAGSGQHVGRGSGVGRDIGRDIDNIAEDTAADLDDVFSGGPLQVAASWPARQAYLSIVGISNVVRMGGSLISAFVKIVSQPRNEQSIGWSGNGDYLLRCVATPDSPEGAPVVRAPSVATTVVRVQDLNVRATEENDRTLTEIEQLRGQLESLGPGPEHDRVQARIRALQHAEALSIGGSVTETLASLTQQLRVARDLEAANRARTPRPERSVEVRLLYAQLQLMELPLAEYTRDLEQRQAQIQALRRRSASYDDLFGAREYRPQVTFASEVNGMVTRLMMRLGQHPRSTEEHPRWTLADVTTPDASRHEGHGSRAGIAGHTEAIRAAFVEFRESAKYGRGTIAIRLPETIHADLGGAVTIDSRMRSAPGSTERVLQRLSDLATAAEIAGILVAGPVGLAIGAVAGIASATIAIHNVSRRVHNRTFDWDIQTAMDIASIVAGGFGVIGPGSNILRGSPRWVQRVDRLQDAIHIFMYAHTGAQLVVIPLQLEQQLRAIDAEPGLSPGERSARRAEAWLQAVRGGIVTTVSAAQMVEAARMGSRRSATDLAPEAAREAPPRPREAAAGEAPRGGDAAPVRQGPATGMPQSGAAPTRARNPRLAELNAALGDLAGQVRVVDDAESSGRSTRVAAEPQAARLGFEGDQVIIAVGPEATPQQIRDHLRSARALLPYRGPMGWIQRLIDRVLSLLRLRPGRGTRGHEARSEVQKLNDILTRLEREKAQIEERARTMGRDADSPARQREIEAEVTALREQLADNERLVNSFETGRGYVAAFETTAEARVLDTLARLRTEFPAETFERAGDRVRVPGGIELPPAEALELLGSRAIGPPRSDLQLLIEASRGLAGAGERALSGQRLAGILHAFRSASDATALQTLLGDLAAGGQRASRAEDFLGRVSRIREHPDVQFDLADLHRAFLDGDAVLDHGPLQTGEFLNDIVGERATLDEGRLVVGSHGRLPGSLTGSDRIGRLDFVIIETSGTYLLILGREHSGLSGHRASVFAAGMLVFDRAGIVTEITNQSGHYVPSEANLRRAVALLLQRGNLHPSRLPTITIL